LLSIFGVSPRRVSFAFDGHPLLSSAFHRLFSLAIACRFCRDNGTCRVVAQHALFATDYTDYT